MILLIASYRCYTVAMLYHAQPAYILGQRARLQMYWLKMPASVRIG